MTESIWKESLTRNTLETRTHGSVYMAMFYIAWNSKSGKRVSLSSTEAQYYATSEVAKEVIFQWEETVISDSIPNQH
jgi:hypothetical protein